METPSALTSSGLRDRFGRVIRYLRLSVTEKCNFRCHYCRLAAGEGGEPRHDPLTTAELVRLVRLFARLGVGRFRLTGGEPLLRRDITTLLAAMLALPGVEEVSLSTNAYLLAGMAQELRNLGLRRVNISLDSLKPEMFARITRGGDLARVLSGIDAAVAAGLAPVKINTVVMGGINEQEIPDLINYARGRGVLLRFIETMPIGDAGAAVMGRHVPAAEIRARILATCGGELLPVSQPVGNGPASYFRIAGLGVDVGIISALSQHFCDTCNRVRLTSWGDLVLCLGREDRVDLREVLRSHADDATLCDMIAQAILRKPRGHEFAASSVSDNISPHPMASLGG
ncbi:MAG: GTP 3',8-cyclase MoaA [Magnetococcales bacterium]|nr:GTP 3',8-cyclase MoaA [Magnetococcales bacterium]